MSALGRVTNAMMSRSLVGTLGDLDERMVTAQRQISTGLRITKPSDDPLAAQRAINLRGALEGAQQHQRNAQDAQGWLQTSDDALSQVNDLVQRVRELTVQGASDSAGPQARQSIALEIDQLTKQVKQTANATYQGAYVFSGTATQTPPYTDNPTPPATADTYQGNTATIARSIGPGVSVPITTDVSSLLGSGGSDGKLIATLNAIKAHLTSGTSTDADALRTTDLHDLDANLDALNMSRATAGSVLNRISAAQTRLGDVESTTNKLLSDAQDTDIAKSILDLTNQQNAYQAALKTGAQLIKPSLLDFLN